MALTNELIGKLVFTDAAAPTGVIAQGIAPFTGTNPSVRTAAGDYLLTVAGGLDNSTLRGSVVLEEQGAVNGLVSSFTVASATTVRVTFRIAPVAGTLAAPTGSIKIFLERVAG
jgi:hypothetical protein